MRRVIHLLFLVLILMAQGCAKEWREEEIVVKINGDFDINKSLILEKLNGECFNDAQYVCTDKAISEFYNHRFSGYIIKSWDEFLSFKNMYFKSIKLSTSLNKDYFKEYNLGIVYVYYTGLNYIKKETLSKANGECIFSYEIWDRRARVVPACEWDNLYMLKLKKNF